MNKKLKVGNKVIYNSEGRNPIETFIAAIDGTRLIIENEMGWPAQDLDQNGELYKKLMQYRAIKCHNFWSVEKSDLILINKRENKNGQFINQGIELNITQ